MPRRSDSSIPVLTRNIHRSSILLLLLIILMYVIIGGQFDRNIDFVVPTATATHKKINDDDVNHPKRPYDNDAGKPLANKTAFPVESVEEERCFELASRRIELIQL